MKQKLNKKALRAFAEKVKVPELVRSLFTKVESEIKTAALFSIRRLGEMLLTTALFNEQGCFAVIFTRKSGEAISYEIESDKFYKQKHIDDCFFGKDTAYINTDIIVSFFKLTKDEKPISSWRYNVESYRELQRDLKRKEKSRKSLALFANLPPIPTNFKNWCRRDFSKITFDTADRSHGHCQYCDRNIETTEKLVQGHTYKCPHCHHSFQAISVNGHRWIREKGYSLYCEMDGIPVIRHFILTIYKTRRYNGALFSFYEYERDLLNYEGYYYRNYIHSRTGRYEYWRNRKNYPNCYGTGDRTLYWNGEPLYPYSSFTLISDKLRKVALSESSNMYRWESALTDCSKNLELAQILNTAGFSKELAYGVYEHYGDKRESKPIVFYGHNPKRILGIDGNIAKLFKDNQYTYKELKKYNQFKKTIENKSPKAFVKSLTFFAHMYLLGSEDYYYEKLCSALSNTKTTVAQVSKYFRDTSDYSTFSLWCDYIGNYCKAAQMADKPLIGKSWVFPPLNNINQKHDEAVKWYKAEYKKFQKKEQAQKEKTLQKFVAGLSSLDNYEIDGMVAILPHSYGDFVIEGNNQHHCVGGHGYFDAMVNAQSIVVFLRTKADESYCTCEFSLSNGEISLRQCRLKQNADAPDKVKKAAIKYGKLLQKQLLLNQAVA